MSINDSKIEKINLENDNLRLKEELGLISSDYKANVIQPKEVVVNKIKKLKTGFALNYSKSMKLFFI